MTVTFDVGQLTSSWGPYLTRAVSDPETRIARVPGKYGFVLKDKPSELANTASIAEVEEGGTDGESTKDYQKRENVLYGLLSEWLISRGYNAEVTASTTKGKQWGNPDVTGILLIDDPLGRQHIELGTIEAKISLNGWRKFFFEAVSHKRFSNRTYFAFAIGADETTLEAIPDFESLRKYGEKYRVGVLAVFMNRDAHNSLLNDSVENLHLTLADVVVAEIWPAQYEDVSVADAYEFVKDVLKLDSPTKVNSFGKF